MQRRELAGLHSFKAAVEFVVGGVAAHDLPKREVLQIGAGCRGSCVLLGEPKSFVDTKVVDGLTIYRVVDVEV